MSDPFLAEIIMFGGNFAPRGWALCDGQLLPISQNQAVFSLLGTTYGGDGRTTFALPDLRGRAAIHPGTGPGLSPYRLGQRGGAETVNLTTAQIPSHTHSASVTLHANTGGGDDNDPTARYPGEGANDFYADGQNVDMGAPSVAVGNTGGSQPHTNIEPYLCVNFIIALQGIFPSRN